MGESMVTSVILFVMWEAVPHLMEHVLALGLEGYIGCCTSNK